MIRQDDITYPSIYMRKNQAKACSNLRGGFNREKEGPWEVLFTINLVNMVDCCELLQQHYSWAR